MNIYKKIFYLCCLILTYVPSFSQSKLSPGFDPHEYIQLLGIFDEQTSHLFQIPQEKKEETAAPRPALPPIPKPENYNMVYESPTVGLDNRWALWLNKDSSIAVISIRGTTTQTESWLENFYAVMLPASSELRVNDSTVFPYKLAENPLATVHAGWLLGLASLAPTIVQEVKKYETLGVKQFIIFGHSQGGALAFLTRSYLYYLPDSILPKNIVYKTYCSAAPKPGNLYYAYDFDYITRGGWAFRVVNEKDWVPETPFSLQTLKDFNEVNPFINIKPALKNTHFLVRLYAMHVFNKLNRSSEKASKKFRKVLGSTLYKMIRKHLPQFPEPRYVHSMNYMPAGTPIILMPYKNYDEDFPYNGKNVFIHHGLEAYYLLTLHQYKSSLQP